MSSSLRNQLKQNSFKERSDGFLTRNFQFYSATDIQLYIADGLKDARDGLKPYKTTRAIGSDLLKVFKGIKNILLGGLGLIILSMYAPVSLIFMIVSPLTALFGEKGYFAELDENFNWAKEFFIASLYNIAGSAARLIRGITQVVSYPLTLLSIPLRMYLSIGLPEQSFQDRKSIKQNVQQIDALLELTELDKDSMNEMKNALNELYRKGVSQVTTKKYPSEGNRKIMTHAKGSVFNITNTLAPVDGKFFFSGDTASPALYEEKKPGIQ